METNDLSNDLPDNISAADQAVIDAAFAEGFGSDNGSTQPSAVEPGTEVAKKPEDTPAVAATAPTEQATTATTATEPAADPYAGLPEDVKAALARIPTLENELRRTTGQVRSLQSAHDRAAAEAARIAASQPEPRSAAHEQVATTLPEVVTTIEEIVESKLKKERAAAPAQPTATDGDTRSPDERRLDEGFPEWRTIAGSNDFALWVDGQRDGQTIRSTTDMVTLLGAITRFKAHEAAQQAQAAAAQRQQDLRAQRIDASAVTPSRGGARRPSAHTQTEEEAFAAGFARR